MRTENSTSLLSLATDEIVLRSSPSNRVAGAAPERPFKTAKMKKIENINKVKARLAFLALLLLPVLVHAQSLDKCPDVVVIRQSLYDSFQNLKGNLNGAEQEILRQRAVLDDLRKRYFGCEQQSDIAAMLGQAEAALKQAENNRKTLDTTFQKVDAEVREIIRAAHGTTVAYRYYDRGYGDLGAVVTMTFSLVDGKVTIIPSYYQLPSTAAR